uniref:40S ribosomal protein S7 n=1 Tax=Astyanax mexicanus TaxID=7994 RepID=A0A8B9GW17_ASTMX
VKLDSSRLIRVHLDKAQQNNVEHKWGLLMVCFWCLCFQEIEVGGSRKAIIIFVPVPQLKSFQKIQVRLVRELEKKFSGKHVVFIAQVRTVAPHVHAMPIWLVASALNWFCLHPDYLLT